MESKFEGRARWHYQVQATRPGEGWSIWGVGVTERSPFPDVTDPAWIDAHTDADYYIVNRIYGESDELTCFISRVIEDGEHNPPPSEVLIDGYRVTVECQTIRVPIAPLYKYYAGVMSA